MQEKTPPEKPVKHAQSPAEASVPLTFWGRFFCFIRINVFAGLIVLAPLVITLWLFKALVLTADDHLQSLIPERYHLNALIEHFSGISIPYNLHGLGLVVGVLFLVLTGLLVRNIVGKKLLSMGEGVLGTIPGVRSVYHAIKQITETVTSANSKSFRKVVMLEYPRKGIWCLGFVTGATKGEVQKETDKKLINVFLPTTPNPTSGFLLFVPESDLTEMDMSVDEGLKMIISAGIVTPKLKKRRSSAKKTT